MGSNVSPHRGLQTGQAWWEMLVFAVGSVLPSALGSQERQDYPVEALHLESSKHFPCEPILRREGKQDSKRHCLLLLLLKVSSFHPCIRRREGAMVLPVS